MSLEFERMLTLDKRDQFEMVFEDMAEELARLKKSQRAIFQKMKALIEQGSTILNLLKQPPLPNRENFWPSPSTSLWTRLPSTQPCSPLSPPSSSPPIFSEAPGLSLASLIHLRGANNSPPPPFEIYISPSPSPPSPKSRLSPISIFKSFLPPAPKISEVPKADFDFNAPIFPEPGQYSQNHLDINVDTDMTDILDGLSAQYIPCLKKRQLLGSLPAHLPPLPAHLRGDYISLRKLSFKMTRTRVSKSARTSIKLVLRSLKWRRRLLRKQKAERRRGRV